MICPFHRWTLCLALVLGVSAFSSRSSAQTRLSYLIGQLENATDFRVRTQAALALGGSNRPEAARPLCRALDDPNDTVRSAAAAALGRLGRPEGITCLKAHVSDRNAAVRSVITRAIATIEQSSSRSSEPPPPRPNDIYYVAIGPTTDRTGRGGTSVADLVRAALQQKLLSLEGYAVAPSKETPAAARKMIRQHKLKGYFLQVSVERPVYANGSLTIQVRVTMWTYPAKSLQGEFSPRLTMSGANPGDRDSEDTLIKMAIERAVESFSRVASAGTN